MLDVEGPHLLGDETVDVCGHGVRRQHAAYVAVLRDGEEEGVGGGRGGDFACE